MAAPMATPPLVLALLLVFCTGFPEELWGGIWEERQVQENRPGVTPPAELYKYQITFPTKKDTVHSQKTAQCSMRIPKAVDEGEELQAVP